jgi:hypothetical protein
MHNSSKLVWIAVIILVVLLHNAKKEFKEFNTHSLSRMQYIESNLLAANKNLADAIAASGQACSPYPTYQQIGLCSVKQNIDAALTDVRPELEGLHKKLDE